MTETTSRQAETEKRRHLLLETAVRAFLELGYQRTGVREIARRAGVSLGNLYNHFPSKEAVLVEIARLEAQEIAPFVAGLQTDDPPSVRLERFVRSYLHQSAQVDHVLLSVEIFAEAVRTPSVAEAFEETRRNLIAALADCLRGLGTENSTDVARLLLEMVEAHAQHLVFSELPCTPQEEEMVLKLIRFGVGSP